MVRPRKMRWVMGMPRCAYFKPRAVPLSAVSEVVLTVDEFEALRLKDLEKLEQIEAAEKMGIHQSTFHRMLVQAREKVVDALVNTKAIKIEGGNFRMAAPGRGRRRRGLRGHHIH
ncbi:DUF134 domain-containing protein [Candidatus Woesearchaeota archaeon]|nr:DUF134 domain-containing protein [Candidatus Woesearchaeota archaeon]